LSFFIIGTDTGVGKTIVATSLLTGLKTKGYSAIGLKPVASGARQTFEGLRSADAISLQKAATVYLPYEQVNPFCFAEVTAPHIAATQQNACLSVSSIMAACQPLLNYPADYRVIEGIGGIGVPLNEKEMLIDLIRAVNFPVILVVGLRLGCLNHALLTWKYLQQHNLKVIAWLANQVDPAMVCVQENIAFLKSVLPIPCVGFFPYLQQANIGVFSTLIDYKILLPP
jgi:dethiobiotin synthetase